MRTVALEEHFAVPALSARIGKDIINRRGYRPRNLTPGAPNPLELLPEIGEIRLKSMDDAGITMQVLSNSGPGPDLLPGADGVALARELNDHLATAIARRPDRFAGFASLPLQSPDAAAVELKRAVKELGFLGAMVNGTTEGRFLDHASFDGLLAAAVELKRAVKELGFLGAMVNGTTEGRFLDHASFDGLLAAAVELDVPIYIHPHIPPEAVRKAYFSGLPDGADRVLETAGWGWHSETAIHLLRMAVAGTLDKHPRLRLIVGHMGEMLPMMMARIDQVFKHDIGHLKRPIARAILDQVWLTTSGIFDEPPLLAALLTFGIDRIMFSVDYPYAPNIAGRKFLDRIALSPDDMAKLTHATADRVLKLKVPAAADSRARAAAVSHA
jgi:predicted TIM-barrel fold metal-dependent hydrolase